MGCCRDEIKFKFLDEKITEDEALAALEQVQQEQQQRKAELIELSGDPKICSSFVAYDYWRNGGEEARQQAHAMIARRRVLAAWKEACAIFGFLVPQMPEVHGVCCG